MSAYLDGIATTLASAAVPYGYALVIWSSGALVSNSRGKPDVAAVVLFASGAAAAYGVLRLVGSRGRVHEAKGIGQGNVLRAGLIHVASIAGALAVAWAVSHLHAWPPWLLAPLCATGADHMGTSISEARELADEHN
jgi:hypothetical protein